MLTADKPKSRYITDVKREKDRLVLTSEYGALFLEPCCDTIVRVAFSPKHALSDKDKPGLIDREPFGDWTYTETMDSIVLALSHLTLSVRRDSGSVSFLDGDRLIFKERDGCPKEFEEFETYILADAEQKTRKIRTADGVKEVLEEPVKVSTGKSYHIRFNFELGDEALYGFGQQEKGFASLRGRTLYIHQANRKIAAAMFVSTAGYGLLTDTYSPLIFNDDIKGTYIYTEADQESDYYFIAGDMNAVIAGYRRLTGKASLLPKWAYGYVQSQERYESQDEILKTVERFRSSGLGLDCIVLDWISWPDGQWGQKSYDETRFPDPKGMIDTLHDEHVRFMISLWPTMGEETADHAEFADRKLFLPACTVYDAFKPEARELYFDQLKRTHFSYGTDAWWCDSSEPFTPEWSHTMRMEEGDLYRAYCEEAGLRMGYEYSNSYPLYHAMGIYENQRLAMNAPDYAGDERRVVNLTRSAYTGQQRFGTVMWSGDTDAKWDTYRDQIAIGLHFSASGLPWWTMDIGAFFVKGSGYWYWNGHYDDTLENKGYCELYTRWYQYAAFLPMFRAHGTDCRREPWNFSGEFYDAIKKANRLRYRLMPYIYSEAGKVWLRDGSLIRWLAFDFTSDRAVWDITDQFMFGGSLMVCPVTKPMYYDDDGRPLEGISRTREVYFPAGCDWYDLCNDVRYEGGTYATVDAPLDHIPVFVRGGSLIPVCDPALSTDEQTGEIEWKRYGDGAVTYELYEDAGDGYGYERGEYTLRTVSK